MNALKKMIGNIEITKDLLMLLIIGGLYALSIALSNTFVNVFLWKQSGKFIDIAIYNLSIVIFQPITFIIAGRLAKRIDRVIVLRLGVISLAVFYLTVLLLGVHAEQFLILLGALLGIGMGFYWLAFNVLTFEITEPDTRDFFNGFLGLLTSFAGMVGPFLAGWIITRMDKLVGYKTIFAISLTLFFAAVIMSFMLNRRSAEGVYSFVRIIKERKRNANWKGILYAHYFQGLREGTFLFVIVVWVFITTNSELALGTFGLINSAVSFLAYYVATRFIKSEHRKKAILFGGIILYAALSLILFELTFAKLITYGVIISIAYPILLVPYVSLTYDVIGRSWKAREMRIEYIVVRELYLNYGRITSICLFIIAITIFDEKTSIPYLLPIVGIGHSLIYFCVRKIKFENKDENNELILSNENGSNV
ncbi:MFS transporter [Pseudalkalibacillus berkeleyi]|uniref:MFS transporter n=1 Tax=Pseudalkalibacillus berkeleyi TaxID=1069813 RepID=A0ABS9GYV0_9BACL|nr:MFS transporter [Pseudalkalibacillus berkeleyi]MCF6137923.1 MFS transporter [Pseudalkalibacillus berkeleyi]